MRKEVLSVFFAAALVGSACQRPPEATPQRTPLATSGEPRPSSLEAEIQARVQATVTAQQETTFKTPQPELELFAASSFEFKYPKGWKKEENQHRPISLIDPKSAKDNPTEIQFYILYRDPVEKTLEAHMQFIEKTREPWLRKTYNYKGPPLKIKQLPDIDGKPALIISVGKHPGAPAQGWPEHDEQEVHILAESETIIFTLSTDPSVTDKTKPLFETVVRTFKERPTQQAVRPAEAQKPAAQGEAPKTMTLEQQAMGAAFDFFYNSLLSGTQNQQLVHFKSPKSLSSQVVMSGGRTFPKEDVRQGKPIPPGGDLLAIEWVSSMPSFNGISKAFGQGEIKNFKLRVSNIFPVTDADRANGIQWKGIIRIQFIYHHRIVKPLFISASGKLETDRTETEWAKVRIPEPTISFSPWDDGSIDIPLIRREGQWEPPLDSGIIAPIPSITWGELCKPGERYIVPGCEFVKLR